MEPPHVNNRVSRGVQDCIPRMPQVINMFADWAGAIKGSTVGRPSSQPETEVSKSLGPLQSVPWCAVLHYEVDWCGCLQLGPVAG